MSVEQYLAFEAESQTRHEYVDGQLFAMSGATKAHNLISLSLASALHIHLRSTPCAATMSDMKVRIETANCFYYPDVMVTCEQTAGSVVYNSAPCFIAEVLSPSTSQTDRREKLLSYKQVPSLKEYLIVHQEEQHAQLYRRGTDGRFVMTEYFEGDEIILTSLPTPLTMPMSQLYEGMQKLL
jgi:Uma2 family endonuclease